MSQDANRKRQERWRQKQHQSGLKQVRVWVPKTYVREVTALAAALREGKPGALKPTPEQIRETKKVMKKRRLTPPPLFIRENRYRLEVWLAFHGINRAVRLPRPEKD